MGLMKTAERCPFGDCEMTRLPGAFVLGVRMSQVVVSPVAMSSAMMPWEGISRVKMS